MRIGCLLILAASCSVAFGQKVSSLQADFSTIRQQLGVHVGNDDVPGLAIAVSRGGEILWEEGFGWGDRERDVRATRSTPFYVASVTKAFTATAILHLAARGRLQIDQPVNKYLDRSKIHSPVWNASEATIRRLLTHTSGLTTFSRWCDTTTDLQCNIDNEIERYGVLVWHPGEVFDYSNLGYGVLGEIVANVSGETLDSYLRKAVFRPLHMRNCAIPPSRPAEQAAAQYDEKTRRRSMTRVSGHEGASGLRCSVDDLLEFGMFQLKDHLSRDSPLSSRDIDEMHTAQPATGGQYGMGWWIRQESGLSIIAAEGGTTDAYALLELIPAKDIAIAVVANSYSQLVSGLGGQIISTLISGVAFDKQLKRLDREKLLSPPPSLIGMWSGEIVTYEGPVKIVLNISPTGGVQSQIADLPTSTVSDLSFDHTHFYGRFPGREGLADSSDQPFVVELELALHGNHLIGAATFGPPPGKDGDQLSHFVNLAKTSP